MSGESLRYDALIDIDLIQILVEAGHDRCFGVSSQLDPERALDEISDGGAIHEIFHQLIRLMPPRDVQRFRQRPPVTGVPA